MMNDQPPTHSAYPAFEPVTLKNQLAQAAKPAHRMVMALIADTATAENLQLHRSAPAHTSSLNCATRACDGDNAPGSKRLSLLDGGAISNAAIAPPYRPLAVARAD